MTVPKGQSDVPISVGIRPEILGQQGRLHVAGAYWILPLRQD